MATINGTNGIDNLVGTADGDSINGFGGNDTIDGGPGDDQIDGGAGIDTVTYLTADGGVDVFLGIEFGSSAVFGNTQGALGVDGLIDIENAIGSNFDDFLTGSGVSGANSFFGMGGNDQLRGGSGDDMLDGGLGNDLLIGGDGFDTIDGGAGIDTVSYATAADGPVEINLRLGFADQFNADGTEIVSSDSLVNVENAVGSAFGDVITGADLIDNVLQGAGGDDIIFGLGGNDTLDGGSGNDTLDGGVGGDLIVGGEGIDTARYSNASGSVQVALDDFGEGFAEGAAGNDTLIGIENLTGSAFDDQLLGNNAANLIAGGGGNDLLFGQGGDDRLEGGGGDDLLRGSDGADTLNGGSGFDRVSTFVATATVGVTINLNLQGVAQDTGHGLDTLIGIEHVSGTILSDVLIGDGGDNWLWGGSDLSGSGVTGNDMISGGGGNDLVEVGNGNHRLDGGTGNDTLSFLGGTLDIGAAGVTFSLALQGTAQDSEQGVTNATGFENLSGSVQDDNLTGDAGANTLLGDLGNDILSGGHGNDILFGDGRIHIDVRGTGEAGAITLFGAAELAGVGGSDILIGGRGDDTLYGGQGDDIMTGGQGRDTFLIEAGSGADRITDFSNFDTIIFDTLSGADDFSDLILAAVGKDTLVTWGTDDSLLLQGIAPRSLDALDFSFGSTVATSSTAVADSLSQGSAFHANELAMGQTAIDLAWHAYAAGYWNSASDILI